MTTNTTYRKMKQERDMALAECERLRADLRDTFAAGAIGHALENRMSKHLAALYAYEVADAMLAARAKP